ncbi:uncharacterized protein LOC123707841 isoform X1 [Pieris brassicae]|uniref:uncharacterized protein LOC123707841 isoform X1 n=1 Tax=Pieris brassicae TaxID=7116 RepID=UPI001E65E8BB|nr:uncharacterized protein LOC123707841 isoform X1 [Pieris brassicae]
MVVTSILFLVFISSTQSLLLPLGWVTPKTIYKQPSNKCIPTATSRGPCITCVCNIDGVYICRGIKCSQTTDLIVRTVECQSNIRYIKDHTVCTCSDSGLWLSENCRKVIRTVRTDLPIVYGNLRSNVTCKSNSLYLIDCNVCKCDKSGLIQATSCTNRHCKTATKADFCLFGDFLRTHNEICLCSDVNYYIDKLCKKISPNLIQELNTADTKAVTDVGFKSNKKCTAFREYYIDCNHCICEESGQLLCTKRDCRQNKVNSRRSNNDELPIVQSVNDLCIPGQKYKLKCNTCICTLNEELSCTTMVCLDDFIIDGLALRRGLISSND